MCDTIPADDSVATQELFIEICTQITDLVWPRVDFKSIQQTLSGDDDQDATSDVEDPRFQDDTLLYWDADTNSLRQCPITKAVRTMNLVSYSDLTFICNTE